MATFYELLNISSKWLIKKGIDKKLADTYVAELFLSLSQDALNKSSRVNAFSKVTNTSIISRSRGEVDADGNVSSTQDSCHPDTFSSRGGSKQSTSISTERPAEHVNYYTNKLGSRTNFPG